MSSSFIYFLLQGTNGNAFGGHGKDTISAVLGGLAFGGAGNDSLIGSIKQT